MQEKRHIFFTGSLESFTILFSLQLSVLQGAIKRHDKAVGRGTPTRTKNRHCEEERRSNLSV
jgi:hypothetical protein